MNAASGYKRCISKGSALEMINRPDFKSMLYAYIHNQYKKRCTVLPEIFAQVLLSFNFVVGVGLHKLSTWNFLCKRNFDRMKFIATCTRCDFLDAVELLLYSSFSFLNKLLTMPLLWYLQPASNKCQGPKWAFLTYCTHTDFSYLTIKLALSDLPFVKRSVCEAGCR